MEILMVITIIGLIAMIGIPIFTNAIDDACERTERVNIARVEAAKEQWAFENNKAVGAAVQWSNISYYMGGSATCLTNLDVNGKSISIHDIGTPASY
jgi:type II secretory pathway pseudopilin PulG